MFPRMPYSKEYLEHLVKRLERQELERELEKEIDKVLGAPHHRYPFGFVFHAIAIVLIVAVVALVWSFT